MTWFLDLRADSAGGNPAGYVTIRQNANDCFNVNDLLKEVRGRDVLFRTHGFNVNREEGIADLSAWANLLELGDNTLFIGVLWPGDSRWAPVVDYPFEGDEAITSGRLLAPFLDKHFTEAVSLSFASHSLGARMILEAIRQMSRSVRVRRLIMMAGAIDDNCLIEEYSDAAKKVDEISVLASHEDVVLKLAFPIGNLLAGIISRGHPYWQGALGQDGPDSPYPENIRSGWQKIPDGWEYGHGDYLGGTLPAMPPPVSVPKEGSPSPSRSLYPAWSAGFVSTRFQRA
ncbi:MAG: alpha/beta hydrolase [Nitrosomonas sp.]